MQFEIEVKMLFQTKSPDYQAIRNWEDILGVTAIIISVSYREQEFFRCGFYVYNENITEDDLFIEPSIKNVILFILGNKKCTH